jgi:hypothetical protein
VPDFLGDGVRPPTAKLRGTREPVESRGVLKAAGGALTPEVREQRSEPGVAADVEPVLHHATASGELAGHRACLALQKRGTRPLGATGQATDYVRDKAVNPGTVQVVYRRGVQHTRQHTRGGQLKLSRSGTGTAGLSAAPVL